MMTTALSRRVVWVQSVAMTVKDNLALSVRAGAEDSGVRLDKFLSGALPDLSRTRIKALIKDRRVASGGETLADPSYRVKPGQGFAVSVPAAAPAKPRGQAIDLAVVYEDAQLIVVDKPAGMVVHPAPGNPDRTLVNALIAHCGDSLSGVGGVLRPGIVHRLDKDTSGLIVAAKSDAAHAALAAQFSGRTLTRAYKAVVWGVPSPVAGEIAGNIGRSPANRKKMAVLRRGGRPAVTRYRVVAALGGAASLVECRLETGRTHQIRVHFSARGHPLIGDPLYGRGMRRRTASLGESERGALAEFRRQALHADRLELRHPTSGEALRFESELPNDMKALIALLGAPDRA
ncbi:MAG: RluA family pseudouridine synthase [Proteobacteria bacterium]|nr:RluA family pseudouridine synthase [Pseudomonadota bacterium]